MFSALLEVQSLKSFFIYRRQQQLFVNEHEEDSLLQKASDLFCAVHSPVIEALANDKEVSLEPISTALGEPPEPRTLTNAALYLQFVLQKLVEADRCLLKQRHQ